MATAPAADAPLGHLGRRIAGPRLRTGALLAGLIGFELLLGVVAATGRSTYALLLAVAIAGFAFVWSFPLASTVLALVVGAGIIYPGFFITHLGGRTFYGYEAILGILVLRAVIQPRRHIWGGPAGFSLAFFFGWLALSSWLAIRGGSGSFNDIFNYSRGFFPLMLFWVVIRLFPDRDSLARLLTAAIVLGAISGLVGIMLALGGSVEGIFQDDGRQVLTEGSIGSLIRVRMPGLALAFMLLWLALFWLLRSRRPTWLWGVSIPLMLLAIAVSQNRNMWLVGIAATAALFVVAGRRARGRLIMAVTLIAVAIALAVAAPQGDGGPRTTLAPLATRATTLLNPQAVSQSDSAKGRETEIKFGWAKAKENLAFGIAPGVPYGLRAVSDAGGGRHTISAQLFLHNQYLYILLIVGIPGLLGFLGFFVANIADAFGRRATLPESKVLGIGLVATMLTAAVMLSFTDTSFLFGIGLVGGAIFALAHPFRGDGAAA